MELLVDRQQLEAESGTTRVRGNFCRVDQGVLSHPYDPEPPSALTKFVHDGFRALVLNERFACVGGRSAVRQNAYRFGLYERMGARSSSAALALDLRAFIEDDDLQGQDLTAFVASFVEPVPADEQTFEGLLWTTLQQLNDGDLEPWSPEGRADPADPGVQLQFRRHQLLHRRIARRQLAVFAAICLVDAGVQSARSVRSAAAAGPLRPLSQRHPLSRRQPARHRQPDVARLRRTVRGAAIFRARCR